MNQFGTDPLACPQERVWRTSNMEPSLARVVDGALQPLCHLAAGLGLAQRVGPELGRAGRITAVQRQCAGQ